VFENVLGQPVITLLASDISGGILAPSMLFSGPPASGKGSAALELGRILSCENSAPGVIAPWNCSCPACARHRQLIHPDLLLLGSRPFSAETAAAGAAILRDPQLPALRSLFFRSVRKLLARFSPVLWEDDPKIGKLNPIIQALDEDLNELEAVLNAPSDTDDGETPDGREGLSKRMASILKNVFKLEAEGIGDLIPVAQIRRAAWWSRLAPQGKRKLLVIENADRMQDGARNSLLKILEEPPKTVSIVLTTAHHGGLLPTILSRLRPYRFIRRDQAVELEVIRRIFRDTGFSAQVSSARTPAAPVQAQAAAEPAPLTGNSRGKAGEQNGLISTYLDSFLPVSGETLYPLGALFTASVALGAVLSLNRAEAPLSDALVSLGKYTAPIAEATGLGRPIRDTAALTAKVLAGTDNFEVRSRFSGFLAITLSLVGESLNSLPPDSGSIRFRDIWRNCAREAETAVGIYNLNPALALDRLVSDLREAMVSYGLTHRAYR
jgi:DNA polymerase-3 subunit gamma/tau